jgi:hypothetical protein
MRSDLLLDLMGTTPANGDSPLTVDIRGFGQANIDTDIRLSRLRFVEFEGGAPPADCVAKLELQHAVGGFHGRVDPPSRPLSRCPRINM